MADTRQRQLDWLNSLMKTTGLKPAQLAEKAKIDRSTISKFINGEIQEMRDRTVLRLARVAGVAPPDVAGLAEGDAAEFDIADLPKPGDITAKGSQFALKVKTRAMEKAGIEPGDILVFDSADIAESGDIICAQVVDYRLGTADTLVRFYDKPFLLALSDDTSLLRPMIVDDDRVQIRGVLVRQFRIKDFGEAA